MSKAKRNWLQPAGGVIDAIGTTGVVSSITGVDRTQVWRWTQPKSKGGTDGLVPPEHMGPLLLWAEKNGRVLTPEMFVRWPTGRRSKISGGRGGPSAHP